MGVVAGSRLGGEGWTCSLSLVRRAETVQPHAELIPPTSMRNADQNSLRR